MHDLLQELKTHPRISRILAGGERLQWGAKTIPEGGFVALPTRFHAPGLLLAGDGVGLVNVPALKGIHYAVESGRLAAEAAWRTLERGTSSRAALASYDDSLRESFIWRDLQEVRNMRQAFGHGFYVGGALASAMTASKGRFPPGDAHTERDAEQSLIRTRRAQRYPAPDGRLTFDKLSSVFASGNRTRDDQPNHIRVRTRVPRELAEMWARMCPAQVYEVGRGRRRRNRRSAPRSLELRPVRSDHRQRRPPDPARRRQRPRVHAYVAPRWRIRHGGCHLTWPSGQARRRTRRTSRLPALADRRRTRAVPVSRVARTTARARSLLRSSTTHSSRANQLDPRGADSERRSEPR